MSYWAWLLPLIVLGVALPFAHRLVRPCTTPQPPQANRARPRPPADGPRMRPVTLLTDLDDGWLHAFILAEYRDDTLDLLAPVCDRKPRPRRHLSRSETRSFLCTKCAYCLSTGEE